MSWFGEQGRWPTTGIYEDQQGYLCYPLGRFSRGRVLPDAYTADLVEQEVSRAIWLIVGASAVASVGVLTFFDLHHLLILPCVLLCGTAGLFVYMHHVLRGFPVTEAPFDSQAWRQRRAQTVTKQDLLVQMAIFGAAYPFLAFYFHGHFGDVIDLGWLVFVLVIGGLSFITNAWDLIKGRYRAD